MNYKRHPLSAAWGDMPADEFLALVDDIEVNGQRDPITLHDGMVLDGWHRCRACDALSLPVEHVALPDGEDPIAWVISKNAKRRSLTASQRALAVAECQEWAPAGRPNNPAPGAGFPATSASMADQAGVSERTVRQAKAVVAGATPEVKAAVQAGTVSVKKAAAVAALPPAQQAAALTDKPVAKPKRELPAKPGAEFEIDELRSTVQALSERNDDLEARVAVESMEASEEEKTSAAKLIVELKSQIKTLEAEADALRSVRNSLMTENSELKRSVSYWRGKAEKVAA